MREQRGRERASSLKPVLHADEWWLAHALDADKAVAAAAPWRAAGGLLASAAVGGPVTRPPVIRVGGVIAGPRLLRLAVVYRYRSRRH